MSIIEFIGFFISMIALIILMGRRARTERQKRVRPANVDKALKKQKDEVKEYLKALHIEMEEEEEEEEIPVVKPKPPPIPIAVKKQHIPARQFQEYKTKLTGYETHSPIEDRHLKIKTTDEYIYEDIVSPDMASIGQSAYDIKEESTKPRVQSILQTLSTPKYMVVFQEILNKPRGLYDRSGYFNL